MARFGCWRRIVAGFAVAALILQSLTLFAPAARGNAPVDAALAALSSLPGTKLAGLILCITADDGDLSGKAPGKPPIHRHDPAACPMCQTLGCGLAGAQAIDLDTLYRERLLGILSIPALGIPPRQRARYAAHPRGPPLLV
jgi:hypothetical protein